MKIPVGKLRRFSKAATPATSDDAANWQAGRVSSRERREAERFFADLLGTAPRPRPSQVRPSQRRQDRVDQTGRPGDGARGNPEWLRTPITGHVPDLRRPHAVQGVSLAATESQLFCIGSDDRLYVKRLGPVGPWSDAEVVAADLLLHPLSALAATVRGANTVHTFFVDQEGLLATASWATWFATPFPSFLVQRIESAPGLRPGGALAATSPQADHLLVFGVAQDGRLAFADFAAGRGWGEVKTTGAPADLLGARTPLTAHAVSPTEVAVAAMSDERRSVVYRFQLSGARWTTGPRLAPAAIR